jgi:hypothetical protein
MEGNLAAMATQGINLSKAINLGQFPLEGKYTNIFGI